jgi:hypothetical protein
MPFGDITIGSKTYKPSIPGSYRESNTTYDGPVEEIRISGATPTRGGNLVGTVRYILEKDVSTGDDVNRRQALVSFEVRVDRLGGFTTTEMDQMVSTISDFITVETLSRILQGES